jgi:hypothetical protein
MVTITEYTKYTDGKTWTDPWTSRRRVNIPTIGHTHRDPNSLSCKQSNSLSESVCQEWSNNWYEPLWKAFNIMEDCIGKLDR